MAWWIFQHVATTAALALAVALVCRGTRLGPVARHALWVIVLVKFVMPPLVAWPWGVPDPLGVAALDSVASNAQSIELARTESDSPAIAQPDAAAAAPVEPPAAGARMVPIMSSVSAFWPWLLGLWIAGSVTLAGVEVVRLVRLARLARRSSPVDSEIARRVGRLAERLRMRPVTVRAIAGQTSPAVWCFSRPALLWPADLPVDSSDACIDGLIVHELAHIKRRDHIVGWIELAAGVVWWWNPLFWFVRSALREQAELACDAWVISTLPDGRRAYAESLLTLSGAAVRATPSMAVVGIRASSRRVLERRLVMIMQGRAPLRLPLVGLVSLALVAALSLPVWAAAARQDPPPPPPPPPPAPVQVIKQTPPPPPPPPAPVAPVAVPTLKQTPPTPPVSVKVQPTIVAPVPSQALTYAIKLHTPANLPADGQELLKKFGADLEAIQKEADQKAQARRDALLKELENLQTQYTKAGKLDEAVAIRDYIRAGMPGLDAAGFRHIIR